MAAKQTFSSKRGPPAPLSSSSSSSEGEGSDHEDVPPSPCSSTASGPTYERPPGFKFHGQEILAPKPRNVSTTKFKKRVKRQPVENGPLRQGTTREEEVTLTSAAVTGSKPKPKKDPLPMKLRALPQSFWQQPNSVNTMSPGNMYLPVLPPLCKSEHSNVDPSEIRPISPTLDDDLIRTKLEDHNYTATEVHPKTSLINNKNNKIKEKYNDSYCTSEVAGKSVLNSPRERDLLLSKEPSQESSSSPVVVRRHPPGRPAARIVKVSPASQEL